MDDDSPHVEESHVIVLGNTNLLQRSGHVFAGWNIQPDGTGNHYHPDETFIIEDNTILYSQWLKIHKVVFEDHEGTLLRIVDVVHGHAATPPSDPSRTGGAIGFIVVKRF